jgi:hypothetical protein
MSGERRVRASVMADRAPDACRGARGERCATCCGSGLIENIQREDLNAIETAEAYQQLMR